MRRRFGAAGAGCHAIPRTPGLLSRATLVVEDSRLAQVGGKARVRLDRACHQIQGGGRLGKRTSRSSRTAMSDSPCRNCESARRSASCWPKAKKAKARGSPCSSSSSCSSSSGSSRNSSNSSSSRRRSSSSSTRSSSSSSSSRSRNSSGSSNSSNRSSSSSRRRRRRGGGGSGSGSGSSSSSSSNRVVVVVVIVDVVVAAATAALVGK